MIINGCNYQPTQSIQQAQQQLFEQRATRVDIKRTQHCTEDLEKKLLNKNIISSRECNRLIIPYGHQKIRVSVHCPQPKLSHIHLFVGQKTYNAHFADIYVGYNPFTLQPEGFAIRHQLVPMQCKPGVWVYGRPRVALDKNRDTLFDLSKLQQLSLSDIRYV